jgi:hypothetical protein
VSPGGYAKVDQVGSHIILRSIAEHKGVSRNEIIRSL